MKNQDQRASKDPQAYEPKAKEAALFLPASHWTALKALTQQLKPCQFFPAVSPHAQGTGQGLRWLDLKQDGPTSGLLLYFEKTDFQSFIEQQSSRLAKKAVQFVTSSVLDSFTGQSHCCMVLTQNKSA